MMKKIVMITFLSLCSLAVADQIPSENIREITYKIVIRHDKKYDKTRWDQLENDTFEIIKNAQEGSGSVDEMIRGLSQALEMVSVDSDIGIHGEMNISIADDDMIKKCGNQCPCIRTGNCQCTTKNNCAVRDQK